jgi:O-antigen/teichoic acid export membrane protein
MSAGALAAAVGFLLLLALRNPAFGPGAAGFLVVCVLGQSASLVLQLLLIAERRMGRAAVYQVLTSLVVPALVAVAWAQGGFARVPAAAALGDVILMTGSLALARRCIRRGPGWLPRKEWRALVGFGGVAAASTTLLALYGEIATYGMGWLGAAPAGIGYVGLGLRLKGFVFGFLGAVSVSLFPSLTMLHESGGEDRAIAWQHLACRMGTLASLFAAGVFLAAGGTLVPLLWGAEYRGAVAPIALLLAAFPPAWIANQNANLSFIKHRPGLALKSVLWMFAIALAAFPGLCRTGRGEGAALALLLGSIVHLAASVYYVRRAFGITLVSGRLLWPALTLLAAWPVGPVTPAGAAERLALWAPLFLLATVASRSVRMFEARDIARAVREALRGARREEP